MQKDYQTGLSNVVMWWGSRSEADEFIFKIRDNNVQYKEGKLRV